MRVFPRPHDQSECRLKKLYKNNFQEILGIFEDIKMSFRAQCEPKMK